MRRISLHGSTGVCEVRLSSRIYVGVRPMCVLVRVVDEWEEKLLRSEFDVVFVCRKPFM